MTSTRQGRHVSPSPSAAASIGWTVAVAIAVAACSGISAPSPSATTSAGTPVQEASPTAAFSDTARPLPSATDSGSRPPVSDLARLDVWLAYQGGPSGAQVDEVHLVRPDGTDDHRIEADVPGRHKHPDWSPDGTELAFDREADPDEVYVTDADGSRVRVVSGCGTSECLGVWEPAWSPDGKRLAVSLFEGPFTPEGPSRFGIAVVEIETGEIDKIIEHAAADGQDHFARWAPDGDRLVFWRARQGDTGVETAIFVVDADGENLKQITSWDQLAGDPDWAPDGDLIVFATRPLVDFQSTGQSELFTMRPDGSRQKQLTAFGPAGPRAAHPRWTPDGTHVVYTRVGPSGSPRHVWAMHADGTGDGVLLAEPGMVYTHPALQPAP